MWKKDQDKPEQNETPVRQHAPMELRGERSAPAVIGASISIKGELTGEEDLLIEGRVEGRVDLKQHKLTVGARGVLRAEVRASVIVIDGDVQGALYGEEQVILRKSCNVQGDIVSPRVSLEDGCKFKGSIDMEPKIMEKQRLADSKAASFGESAKVMPVASADGGLKPGLRQ